MELRDVVYIHLAKEVEIGTFEMINVPRRRFYTLDAMRGTAALIVALYHCEHIGIKIVPSGYLAVDFFFSLSGLVIANAYACKITDNIISIHTFMLMRIVRLYPLYIAGTVLGLVAVSSGINVSSDDAWNGFNALRQTLAALLMLPSPWSSMALYPANPPAWSLLFEVLINFIFAALLFFTRTTKLILLWVFSCIILAISSYYLSEANFGAVWPHALGGIHRVMSSFTIGVILNRFITARTSKRTIWAIVPIVVLAVVLFLNPHLLTSMMYIGAVFPIILVVGSYWELPKITDRLCEWLGDMSYPLYVTHFPILFLWHALAGKFKLSSASEVTGFMIIAVVAATLLIKPDARVRRTLSKLLAVRLTAMPNSR